MARGKKRSKKQQNVSTEAERKGLGPKNQHVKSPIKMHDKPAGSAVTGSKADEAKQLNLSSGLSSACSSPAFNGFDSAKVNRKRSVDISDEVSHPSSDQCDTDSDREVTHCSTYINGIYNSKPLCDYCSLTFKSESELSVHCQSEAHQIVVMSDSGREWEHRPPPRGLLAEGYTLCENWDKTCKYGTQCVEAHSAEELQEWCERFEYRQNKIQQAEQQNLLGKSYTEQLLEKWTSNPDNVLKEKVDYAEDCVSENQLTTTVSKDSKTDWTFLVKTSRVLKAVVLLQFPDRHRFSIKCVKRVVGGESVEWSQQDCQEWISPEINKNSPDNLQVHKSNLEFKYSVCVEFFSDIYGTFRQTVAFDFGVEPLLVKHLCVDVRPASFASNVDELKKELFMEERWDENNAEIMKFSTSDEAYSAYSSNGLEELLRLYPTPTPSTFTLTQSTVTERTITKNNYPSRMHELLGVEEMARYQQVARYNVRAKLNVTKSYLLAPAGTTHSTAKYAQNDQLYAVMNLTQAISEDTAAGRLILSNCTSVLLCAAGKSSKLSKEDSDTTEPVKRKVFEALIEDKGKNVIYLKLSSEAVKEYNIVGGRVFHAEVQFQLNRLPYCEWHHAVDSIQDYKMLFPETFLEPNIPWSPQRQWKEITETKLNVKQKEAIVAITTPLNIQLPPVLIIGPFGTGKTYTLAQAIKQLLSVPDSRIIVCTHSNSAADIYIIDYLHPYVLGGHEAARPLRIYYHKRWVTTVHPTVQKYCLIKTGIDGTRRFQLPTAEDIMKHRVIVVTLNMSMVLSTLGLKKGCFTHIFLDEAAQAMECEAIMPLAVAGERTRIVLAGDHMQLNPELFSPFAKERNLHISLLERLYDHYPTTFPCKILLTENYRAHEAIIKFTSDLFYDQKLVCSGRQPGHPKFYPLTFFACRGEDVQETNSTSHYNLAEVYEIAERVIELRKCWPSEWGDLNDQSIGIMTPYADQVFRIRCELRRRNLGAVSVESVLNVQGKQFRAIFISTVRTRKTCNSGAKSSGNEESEYGFLSNSKLLNTAITRAQSLVAVVGDPIALCSLGRCRKVWESYIKSCDERNSLFGMPWSTIQAHLDGVEFKTSYVLNPLAPEFIPRAKSNLYNNSGNDALVLNGYHSHLAYFDQSSPGQTQPTYPYPQQWNGPGHRPGSGTMPASASKPLPALGPVPAPGPGIGSAHQSSHVEGQFHPNMYRPSHVHNTPPPQQQPYGAYHAHHAPAQKWGVPPDSHYRSSVQQAYLVGTCRFQPTPEVVQPTASLHAPHVPVHIIPQPPTLWPGTGHQANSGAHIAPPGLAVPPGLPAPPGLAVPPGLAAPPGLTAPPGLAAPANLNSKGFESAPVESKLIIQGGVDIPSNELLGNSIRSSKINGIVLDSGAQAFNASNTVQHIEPYSAQIAQSMQPPTHQIVPQSVNPAFFSNRQSPYQLQFAQQQALLQQLTQHSQPPGTQRPILQQQPVLSQQVIANGPFLAIVPNPQINPVPINSPQMQQQQKQLQLQQQQHHHQQQLQQLQQLQQQRQQMNHQLLQQPEQQLQNQLMQLQPMSESFGHEQRLREVENQLRLQQEQHRQQQLQLAILQERRKLLLGHILTPLVNCKPEWNKLIPRGVNLLDMVDNKSQQEEWFNHLIRHGQGELAKMFAEFMVLCVRAITATSSDQRQPSTSPPLNKILSSNPNVTMTANAVESVTATSLLSSPNNHQEPSSTVLASDDEKPTIETSKQTDEPVIMMKDLDPKYMLGSDALLNGGKSVWAIAQDELERCSRNGARSKAGNASQQKSFQKTNTFDSDDSGDELLSSINRQLNLQQSVDE